MLSESLNSKVISKVRLKVIRDAKRFKQKVLISGIHINKQLVKLLEILLSYHFTILLSFIAFILFNTHFFKTPPFTNKLFLNQISDQ